LAEYITTVFHLHRPLPSYVNYLGEFDAGVEVQQFDEVTSEASRKGKQVMRLVLLQIAG